MGVGVFLSVHPSFIHSLISPINSGSIRYANHKVVNRKSALPVLGLSIFVKLCISSLSLRHRTVDLLLESLAFGVSRIFQKDCIVLGACLYATMKGLLLLIEMQFVVDVHHSVSFSSLQKS